MKKRQMYTRAFLVTLGFFLFNLMGCSPKTLQPVNVDSNGVAMKGYDTVAYFTQGKPVKGSSEFEHKWNGAKWHFVNAEHLSLFKNDPEKYAPRYGGY